MEKNILVFMLRLNIKFSRKRILNNSVIYIILIICYILILLYIFLSNVLFFSQFYEAPKKLYRFQHVDTTLYTNTFTIILLNEARQKHAPCIYYQTTKSKNSTIALSKSLFKIYMLRSYFENT